MTPLSASSPGWGRQDLGVQLGAKWTDRLCLMEGNGEIRYNRSR